MTLPAWLSEARDHLRERYPLSTWAETPLFVLHSLGFELSQKEAVLKKQPGKKSYDLCRVSGCEKYASGCSPIPSVNGVMLRVPQRDKIKRYCPEHRSFSVIVNAQPEKGSLLPVKKGPMDKCRVMGCILYAIGSKPLYHPNGAITRILQRDPSKRYCYRHDPQKVAEAVRRQGEITRTLNLCARFTRVAARCFIPRVKNPCCLLGQARLKMSAHCERAVCERHKKCHPSLRRKALSRTKEQRPLLGSLAARPPKQPG